MDSETYLSHFLSLLKIISFKLNNNIGILPYLIDNEGRNPLLTVCIQFLNDSERMNRISCRTILLNLIKNEKVEDIKFSTVFSHSATDFKSQMLARFSSQLKMLQNQTTNSEQLLTNCIEEIHDLLDFYSDILKFNSYSSVCNELFLIDLLDGIILMKNNQIVRNFTI